MFFNFLSFSIINLYCFLVFTNNVNNLYDPDPNENNVALNYQLSKSPISRTVANRRHLIIMGPPRTMI